MNTNALPFKLSNLFRVTLVFSVLAISGCGIEKESSSISQTAAKVNRAEITVEQINFVLQQQGVPPGQVESVRRDVLERLINQELTLQRAKELRLERDARVSQQLDAVQRDLIARAYIDRIVNNIPGPTSNDISEYYEKNPALFKERKIYNFLEFSIYANSINLDELRAGGLKINNPSDLMASLKKKGLYFSSLKTSKAVEELPISMIEDFVNLKNGQYVVHDIDRGIKILLLLDTQRHSLSEEQARPSIEEFILKENKRKVIEEDLSSLRGGAYIEYFGDYAKDKGGGSEKR